MLSINISEVVWTVFNFFLLYFVLKHFLYDPIVTFMDERQARINEGIDAEKAALEEVKKLDERIDEQRRISLQEAERLLAEEKSAEDSRRMQIAERERQTLTDSRIAVKERVEELRQTEQKEFDEKEDVLARLLAEKLLGESGEED